MNKNYISGRNVEYKAIKKLREEGAIIAQRSAGSHSLVDIFACLPDGSIKLIQVKTGSSPLHFEKLAALPHAENVSIELWHWKDGKFTIYR